MKFITVVCQNRFGLRISNLLLKIFFPCRDIFHKMDRFLDDDRIKAILLEEDSSEEERGSDEDDNEERVVNESDHDTDSEFEICQKENSN